MLGLIFGKTEWYHIIQIFLFSEASDLSVQLATDCDKPFS